MPVICNIKCNLQNTSHNKVKLKALFPVNASGKYLLIYSLYGIYEYTVIDYNNNNATK